MRENACERITTGSVLTSDWMKKWCEVFLNQSYRTVSGECPAQVIITKIKTNLFSLENDYMESSKRCAVKLLSLIKIKTSPIFSWV